MQNIKILDVFELFNAQKIAKMPEGPFCQIRARIYLNLIDFGARAGEIKIKLLKWIS